MINQQKANMREVIASQAAEIERLKRAIEEYLNSIPRTGSQVITIEIEGGVLTDVTGLPDGWEYKLIDHDI